MTMANLSEYLSSNFTVGELLRSDTAERDPALKREQENPPDAILLNLRYLVETVLQPIRTGISYPIRISSGYRCLLVNQLVGGSATSQHVTGEAADCSLSRLFLSEDSTASLRSEIMDRVRERTGKPLRPEVNADFYLFAYICMHLDELDIDQVIHEYGDALGQPAWVHVAASTHRDRRQILAIGSYTNRNYVQASVQEALAFGT